MPMSQAEAFVSKWMFVTLNGSAGDAAWAGPRAIASIGTPMVRATIATRSVRLLLRVISGILRLGRSLAAKPGGAAWWDPRDSIRTGAAASARAPRRRSRRITSVVVP